MVSNWVMDERSQAVDAALTGSIDGREFGLYMETVARIERLEEVLLKKDVEYIPVYNTSNTNIWRGELQ